MSHVARVAVEVRDLEALKAACKQLGLEWREGQTKYAWYGVSVGDYPLPVGFAKEDLGHCEHAIHVPGAEYEVGVCRRRDGKPGFELLWDFYSPGGLTAQLGTNGQKLVQGYAIAVATKAAKAQGYTVKQEAGTDGKVRLVLSKWGG